MKTIKEILLAVGGWMAGMFALLVIVGSFALAIKFFWWVLNF